MNNISSQKFFLYARKSTDVEDKQVLSIEAQLTELREYAVREGIEISAEIVEKQSAKVPGRPLFNKMMKEIETFGGNILAWNPDRLIQTFLRKRSVPKKSLARTCFLAKKTLRVAEGGAPNSFGKMGGNQWDAVRGSHLLALKKPLSSVLVLGRGLAPPRLTAYAPQTYVFTKLHHPSIACNITSLQLLKPLPRQLLWPF